MMRTLSWNQKKIVDIKKKSKSGENYFLIILPQQKLEILKNRIC